jgi:tripartite-type tricarboxylate transporter receptor subunit TctC
MKKTTAKTDRFETVLPRRRALALAGGSALCAGLLVLGWPRVASAQAYPSKPIRMVIAFPPGGGTDVLARAIAQRLGAKLEQQVIVENRPGAGGMIGLETAAKAAPDGYTVFLSALTNQTIAGHLYANAKADISRDFDPVALLANAPHVLNVHPSVPAKTLGELVVWLKANDGKVNYASQGNGTLSHLEAEMLAQRLGVKVVHVPYKGSSQALPDLLAGNVSFMFDSVAASMTQVKAGKLRSLAVAATQRIPAFPDLPTVAESGVPGYDADNWFGLFVPKGTPTAVIGRLNEELAKVLLEPELGAFLVQQGYVVTYGAAKRLADVTAAEIEKWGAVVKAANIKVGVVKAANIEV